MTTPFTRNLGYQRARRMGRDQKRNNDKGASSLYVLDNILC